MKYKSEKEMYPDVCRWLEDFLTNRVRDADVDVYDLSRTSLSRFLRTYNKGKFPGEWVTWDIRVDVVGFVHHSQEFTSLAFVECKNTSLTLAHLSQVLGYSRIAQPLYSFLISSTGISPVLLSLLQNYQRYDVLEYHWEKGKKPRNIIVAQWEKTTRNLNWHTMIGGAGI